jgi:hypothetical protein
MPLVAFCLRHFSADFIICTCEFECRQAHRICADLQPVRIVPARGSETSDGVVATFSVYTLGAVRTERYEFLLSNLDNTIFTLTCLPVIRMWIELPGGIRTGIILSLLD